VIVAPTSYGTLGEKGIILGPVFRKRGCVIWTGGREPVRGKGKLSKERVVRNLKKSRKVQEKKKPDSLTEERERGGPRNSFHLKKTKTAETGWKDGPRNRLSLVKNLNGGDELTYLNKEGIESTKKKRPVDRESKLMASLAIAASYRGYREEKKSKQDIQGDRQQKSEVALPSDEGGKTRGGK